jgi:hypothetical protein
VSKSGGGVHEDAEAIRKKQTRKILSECVVSTSSTVEGKQQTVLPNHNLTLSSIIAILRRSGYMRFKSSQIKMFPRAVK